MEFNTFLSFLIGIGVYLVLLGVWALFKRYRNKKKFNDEVQSHYDVNNDDKK